MLPEAFTPPGLDVDGGRVCTNPQVMRGRGRRVVVEGGGGWYVLWSWGVGCGVWGSRQWAITMMEAAGPTS